MHYAFTIVIIITYIYLCSYCSYTYMYGINSLMDNFRFFLAGVVWSFLCTNQRWIILSGRPVCSVNWVTVALFREKLVAKASSSIKIWLSLSIACTHCFFLFVPASTAIICATNHDQLIHWLYKMLIIIMLVHIQGLVFAILFMNEQRCQQ